MNTEYIHEFVVLAETKNFWEASERLFMNQSTLSKHIKSLEIELGVPLFTRTTRRVELTNYGHTFLPYAQSIATAEFSGTSAIKQLLNIENGLLTIGTLPSMPQYKVTQLLAQFQSAYPETSIRLSEDDPINLMQYLQNENCEIVFSREDKQTFEKNFLQDSNIRRIPYIKDSLVALMQKTHPLANSESVTLPQLRDEQFCLIKEGSMMYKIAIEACQQAGFIPNIIFTSHRVDSIIDMVTNQNCIALLMNQHIAMPENGPKTLEAPWVPVPIVPNISSQISICYRTDKPLSKTAQLFVDFCTSRLFNEKQ